MSPTGGGVLTPYGKSIADEIYGTWSYEGASGLAYGAAKTPDWLLVGGDTRFLAAGRGLESAKDTRYLLMQSDLELALRLSDQVSFVGAGGYYGIPLPEPNGKPNSEVRRAYVLLAPQPWLTLRAGRFMPGWGLMIPDHTANIRGGFLWPQGSESENLEIGLYSSFGEGIFAYGKNGSKYARLVGYVADKTQVGMSLGSDIYGFFLISAIGPKAYVMAEHDAKPEVKIEGNVQSLTVTNYLWGQLGGELAKSLWLIGNYQTTVSDERLTRYSYGLQWFPFPHFELFGKLEKENTQATYLLMGHYYL